MDLCQGIAIRLKISWYQTQTINFKKSQKFITNIEENGNSNNVIVTNFCILYYTTQTQNVIKISCY